MLQPAHLLRIERLTSAIAAHPVQFCFLLCVVFILPGLVGHEPWKPDEAAHFGVLFQLLQSGDWVVPGLAGETYLNRPTLFYLVAAYIGSSFAPPLELHDAVRLASGLFVGATLVMTALAAHELFGAKRGWVAALSLLGCTGLLVRSHQLIPDLAYLAGYATSIYALALSARRPHLASVLLGCGIGTAFTTQGMYEATGLGIAALICVALPVARPKAPLRWLLLAILVTLPWLCIWPALLYQRSPELFAHWLYDISLQRFADIFTLAGDEQPMYYLRILPWFAWPALPLAGYALWAKRKVLSSERALLVPLVFFLVTIVGLSVDAQGHDVLALPLLVPLAILAAIAIDSLPRGVANGWFWFSIMLFSFLLFVIWFYFVAVEYGLPARLAQHMRDMQPGYVADTPPGMIAAAAAYTIAWCVLLFNVRRTAERPVIIWSAGVTVVWSVLVLLMVGYADTGKSYRWMVSSLQAALPTRRICVSSENLGEAQRAMFHYYAGLVTSREENPSAQKNCDVLLVQDTWKGPREINGRWQLIWQGARPGDNVERYRLFRRAGPQ
jgi:4-amino-4-deoxy-L-arabinose transferase-like glycosyltransferase